MSWPTCATINRGTHPPNRSITLNSTLIRCSPTYPQRLASWPTSGQESTRNVVFKEDFCVFATNIIDNAHFFVVPCFYWSFGWQNLKSYFDDFTGDEGAFIPIVHEFISNTLRELVKKDEMDLPHRGILTGKKWLKINEFTVPVLMTITPVSEWWRQFPTRPASCPRTCSTLTTAPLSPFNLTPFSTFPVLYPS